MRGKRLQIRCHPSELLKQGLLYPLQSNILETEVQTAARVAKLVFDSGLARVARPDDMVAFIRDYGLGQVYIKILPDGEPVQLAHDNLYKKDPTFSPDGSRVA